MFNFFCNYGKKKNVLIRWSLKKSAIVLGHHVCRCVHVLLLDKRHRISSWRHVLITAPYQNNIIIPAAPHDYPVIRRIALTFRDFVSCTSAKAAECRKRSDKWKSRLLSLRGTDFAFMSFLSDRDKNITLAK